MTETDTSPVGELKKPVVSNPPVGGPPAGGVPNNLPQKPPPPPPFPSPRPSGTEPIQLKSLVRTMKEDIESIKKGQQPSGIPIVKTPEKEVTKPVSPSVSPPVSPPRPFVAPKVELPRPEKAAPLPTPPSIRPPVPIAGPPLPVKLPLKPVPTIEIPPPRKSIFTARFTSLIIVGVIIIGFAYWFLFLKAPEAPPVVIETPTPELLTPTPVISAIEDVVGKPNNLTITLTDDPFDQLKTFIATPISPGSLNFYKPIDETGVDYSFDVLLDIFQILAPQDALDSLNNNAFALFLYGQQEKFNGPPEKNRIGFIIKSNDKAATLSALSLWEEAMVNDLNNLFNYDAARAKTSVFLDNTYNGVALRYVNFPNPDLSLDYGIMTRANGDNYVIVTNSREAIYAILDLLAGF